MRRYIRIIGIAFICSTMALAYFGYLLLNRFSSAVKYTNEVNHTYEIINKLEQLESYAKDAETAQRGFVITNDSSYLAPLFDIRQKVFPMADTLINMIRDQQQKERLIMLKATMAMLMNHVNQNLQMAIVNKYSFLKKDMDDGKRLMDSFRTEVTTIRITELKLLADRNNAKSDYLKSSSVTFVGILSGLALIVVASFILLIRELRKRHKTELQLQQQIIDLQQFTKESEELSYAISHDLQEPLRKMRIFTDRLFQKHKDELNAEGKEIVQRMNIVAATAQETMNELLRFTFVIPQIEQRTTIDLNIMLPNIWEKMAEKTAEKNATITIEDLPTIRGAEQRINILFENLLDNALVFSKAGIAPAIKITAFKTTGQTIKQAAAYQRKQVYNAIEITDNGIGFDDSYATKIFQLFRRLHVGQDKFAGKGLGLAICQRIMSNHHGFIGAKGKPGEGAVFTVYFPAE